MALFLEPWTESLSGPSLSFLHPSHFAVAGCKNERGVESATETEIKDVRPTADCSGIDRAATHSVTDSAFALEILLYDGHGGTKLLKGR